MEWLVELWWIGPAVIGAGTVGWASLRSQRRARARRLAYDASRQALRSARHDATVARVAVRVARAELTRAQAERAAGRANGTDVAAARRALEAAQRDTRSAAAAVRVRRANVSADRAALSRASAARAEAPLPLARLIADDDAVTARWMDYETDAAKLLAFPAMSDPRVPETAAFLAELRTTRALRPASAAARITPAQFGAYRDAVARLAHALDIAEVEAWRRARADGTAPAGPGPDTASAAWVMPAWVAPAQEIVQNLAQTVLDRGTEALARATAARSDARADDDRSDASDADAPERPSPSPAPPVWPVPGRGTRPSRP